MRLDADVVIVGAGPSGCAAAITLGRRGFRVMVIDRARFPRDKPCGDYCNPGAVAALESLGCLVPVLHAGASPIDGMRIVGQDGAAISPRFPTGRGVLIRRRVLDAAVVACAAEAGADVIEGTPVADIQHADGRVRVQLDGGRSVTAALAIVCDGMHSSIGRRLGLLASIGPQRYTVGTYVSGVGGPAQGEIHLGRAQYCGVARFGDGTANVCMALPREALRRRSPAQVFPDMLHAFPRLATELAGARYESGFRASGPIGFRANRSLAGRVMLAGDAGAQVDPMTGQGMFFALRTGILAGEAAAAALSDGSVALRGRVTPWLIRRLHGQSRLAGDLVGVTGDVLPASAILNPGYVLRLLVSAGDHAPGA